MSAIRIKARFHGRLARGFSLLEVVLVLFVLSAAIIPMLSAVTPASRARGAEERTTVFANRARATMNRILVMDFATLDALRGTNVNLTSLFGSEAEAARETFVFRSTTNRPSVAIADASSATGGLINVIVTLGDIRLQTLKADY